MPRILLDPERKLVAATTIKLTVADRQAWQVKVESSGLTASEFFRLAVLRNQTVVTAVKRVQPTTMEVVRLYAGLAARVETLVDQAFRQSVAGTLGVTEYQSLIYQLSRVMESFHQELRRDH